MSTNTYAQEKAQVFPKEGLMVFKGLDDTSSPPVVLDGRASDIQNIILDNTGTATKRYGYSFEVMLDTNDVSDAFNATTSLYELVKSNGITTRIATTASKLFAWSLGNKTDITSGVTITPNDNYLWNWITAFDYAIGTNGVDPPIQTNGTTTSTFNFTGLTATSVPTKAKCVIFWKNYLVFGNTYENSVARTTRIRWSNVGTISTWSDDDYQDIATLGGQQIEGFGTIYDDLYIFLTDSIYKVSLTGGDALITVTKVSEGIGAVSRNNIKSISIGNTEGLIFLTRDKTINYLDGVKVQEISSNIDGVMDDLSQTRLKYASAIVDRGTSHYYLSVTSGTGSTNNQILDFNYGIGEWSKHKGVNANAFCIANDANEVSQVYFGDYDSFIFQMSDPDLNSDVAGETGVFDSSSIIDTTTASGLVVLYDTSADFTDVTGATVTITSGTGIDEESVIASTTSSGIVVVGNLTATTNSGYSIGSVEAYYTTKWYDFGSSPQRKNYGELFLWATTDTSATMQIFSATDFSSTIASTDVTLNADGSLWGTAIWGNSTWGGTSTSLSRIPLSQSGRFIKYRFSESSIDEPMELYGYSTIYWPGDYF
uniref:Uncharacterized protein n=2 Tax=viral metagenome TaxID=1070528 RepID=A0A6M3IW50_9ZZZZ